LIILIDISPVLLVFSAYNLSLTMKTVSDSFFRDVIPAAFPMQAGLRRPLMKSTRRSSQSEGLIPLFKRLHYRSVEVAVVEHDLPMSFLLWMYRPLIVPQHVSDDDPCCNFFRTDTITLHAQPLLSIPVVIRGGTRSISLKGYHLSSTSVKEYPSDTLFLMTKGERV
jgi:hypothetical protein